MSDYEIEVLDEDFNIKNEIEIKEEVLDYYIETNYTEEFLSLNNLQVFKENEPYVSKEICLADESWNQKDANTDTNFLGDFDGFTIDEQEKNREKIKATLKFLGQKVRTESNFIEKEFVGFTYLEQQKNKDRIRNFFSLIKRKNYLNFKKCKIIGKKARNLFYKGENKVLFSCCKCNFKTYFKNKFKKHSSIHSEIYKCTTCNYKSKHHGFFKKHIKKHVQTGKSQNEVMLEVKDKYFEKLNDEIITDPFELLDRSVLDEVIEDNHLSNDNLKMVNIPKPDSLPKQDANFLFQHHIEDKYLYPIVAEQNLTNENEKYLKNKKNPIQFILLNSRITRRKIQVTSVRDYYTRTKTFH